MAPAHCQLSGLVAGRSTPCHGIPTQCSCPEGRRRSSIAAPATALPTLLLNTLPFVVGRVCPQRFRESAPPRLWRMRARSPGYSCGRHSSTPKRGLLRPAERIPAAQGSVNAPSFQNRHPFRQRRDTCPDFHFARSGLTVSKILLRLPCSPHVTSP